MLATEYLANVCISIATERPVSFFHQISIKNKSIDEHWAETKVFIVGT